LEFDTVILMSPTKEDNDNLTANKLYTLCTRSKENLYLFMDHNL
jgi:DNA helicase IV